MQLSTTVLISFAAVNNQAIGNSILRYPALAAVNAIAGFGLWSGSLYHKSSYPTNLQLLAAGTCCLSYTFAVLCAAAARNGLGPELLHAASLSAAAVASCAINAIGTAEPCPLRALGAAVLGIVTLSLAPPAADLAGTLPAAAAATAAAASLVASTWEIMAELGPDDAVEACIRLYVDSARMFLRVLEALAEARRRQQERQRRRPSSPRP